MNGRVVTSAARWSAAQFCKPKQYPAGSDAAVLRRCLLVQRSWVRFLRPSPVQSGLENSFTNPNSTQTAPKQCPSSAQTVPKQCPNSAQTVPKTRRPGYTTVPAPRPLRRFCSRLTQVARRANADGTIVVAASAGNSGPRVCVAGHGPWPSVQFKLLRQLRLC
eukprot:356056-Chlamydomonas_euryale.AAC.7